MKHGHYSGENGDFEVKVLVVDWVDEARSREVPAKIYYPVHVGPAVKFPLVIFSHGLGGTRQGYEYLGRCWASHGYLCVHVQHRGSDNQTGKNTGKPSDEMRRAVTDVANLLNRPRDVSFAIDRMEETGREPSSAIFGCVDMERIAVAGHSFGAYTAHAIAGRVYVDPEGGAHDLGDARVCSCVALSAPAKDTEAFKASFIGFRVPCLHVTGVQDVSPLGETRAEDRRLPFDSIGRKDQYLVTFRDADHMVFTGKVWPNRDPAIDEEIHRLVKAGTLLFWAATLRGEGDASALLEKDGLEVMFGDMARVERKR